MQAVNITGWTGVLGKSGGLDTMLTCDPTPMLVELVKTNHDGVWIKLSDTEADAYDGNSYFAVADTASTNEGCPTLWDLEAPPLSFVLPDVPFRPEAKGGKFVLNTLMSRKEDMGLKLTRPPGIQPQAPPAQATIKEEPEALQEASKTKEATKEEFNPNACKERSASLDSVGVIGLAGIFAAALILAFGVRRRST